MYLTFFGFRERPFGRRLNPQDLLLSHGQAEALATLRYGLTSSPGISLLLGEAGTGKTTLLRAAVNAERRPQQRCVVLTNPTLTRSEFYEMLAEQFGLAHTAGSKARFLLEFERDVLERHHQGGATVLVIDEAQGLTPELLEEVRLLANLESESGALVNLMLVGQPELAELLDDASLRQLKQRITLRCSLVPLDLQESAAYIAGRITVAGGEATAVFTKDAVLAVHEASRGIPKTIDVLCENALLGAVRAQRKPVDRLIVADVCRDLELSGSGRSSRERLVVLDRPAKAAARTGGTTGTRQAKEPTEP